MRSIGSRGDSYDNALAEAVSGLYKAEVIHSQGASWRSLEHVELATTEWVDWCRYVGNRRSASNRKKPVAITAHIYIYARFMRAPEGAVIFDRPHKWNHRRLHSTTGYVPPVEYEARYYRQQEAAQAA